MRLRRLALFWRHAFLGALALLAVLVSLPGTSQALCILPQEQGNWINADPQTNSITRIQLRFVCQDVILNGQPWPPGPPWYVHVYGRCHPTDCDWGEVGAQRLNSGFIYAFYDQGFARRYVYAKMSAYRPGQLWVYIWTDFVDPSRPDYASNNWFVRAAEAASGQPGTSTVPRGGLLLVEPRR
ncbi:hypothetical protein [Benzoatithermus flavus]|uniref:Uncharacterized protein n=1 Tax=Benzoatithermus flavus TaxID=3108223 RepID=A0ABU8XMK0_9PROT